MKITFFQLYQPTGVVMVS